MVKSNPQDDATFGENINAPFYHRSYGEKGAKIFSHSFHSLLAMKNTAINLSVLTARKLCS